MRHHRAASSESRPVARGERARRVDVGHPGTVGERACDQPPRERGGAAAVGAEQLGEAAAGHAAAAVQRRIERGDAGGEAERGAHVAPLDVGDAAAERGQRVEIGSGRTGGDAHAARSNTEARGHTAVQAGCGMRQRGRRVANDGVNNDSCAWSTAVRSGSTALVVLGPWAGSDSPSSRPSRARRPSGSCARDANDDTRDDMSDGAGGGESGIVMASLRARVWGSYLPNKSRRCKAGSVAAQVTSSSS
jgi:hypothetical protein